ncbi:uncharacterized protein BROUX77_002523 [Berkeleyomyces rouxiae]|uniref:uncharacterized protein n=1 Tax=Berkeleyomyces rouxiae TaxID=2035830 RepID=UPI003B78B75A
MSEPEPEPCPMDEALMEIDEDLFYPQARRDPLRVADFNAFVMQAIGLTIEDYLRGARVVRDYSESLDLKIVSLQPFANFDGMMSASKKELIKEAFTEVWLKVLEILGVMMVGVPAAYNCEEDFSNILYETSEDVNWISQELLKTPGIMVGYEPLCFSRFNSTWQAALNVVNGSNYKSILDGNLPITGLIIDTFNLCGSTIANPITDTGFEVNGHEILDKSLDELKRSVAVKNGIICLVQVADAKLVKRGRSNPYDINKKEVKRVWSRNYRLFPCETKRGAYLPVLKALRELTDPEGIAYQGYISLEVFVGSSEERTIDPVYHSMAASYMPDQAGSWGLPTAAALECGHRARTSWMRLCGELGWQSDWSPKTDAEYVGYSDSVYSGDE